MLQAHLNAEERKILVSSGIAGNTGHPIHKGTPREHFIREFLSKHVGTKVSLGTGEIIDCDSLPGQSRPQIDIVVYNPELPKLAIGGDVDCFLSESVIATIEVKSVLDKAALKHAVRTSAAIKQLKRNLSFPVIQIGRKVTPPPIISYLVAYDTTSRLESIHQWLHEVHDELRVTEPILPATLNERKWEPSPSIDVIILLGKGFLYFDNTEVNFVRDDHRQSFPFVKWVWSSGSENNLLYFFSHLSQAISTYHGAVIHLIPYLKRFTTDSLDTCGTADYGCKS